MRASHDKQRGAFLARLAGGQHRQRSLGGLDALLTAVEVPLHAGELREHARVAMGVALGVDLVERGAQQDLAAAAIIAAVVGAGRDPEQADVVQGGDLGGVGHSGPQLEGAPGEGGGLAVGVDAPSGQRGADGGPQGGGLLAGGGVVTGDRRRDLDLAVVGARRPGVECPGQR